MAYKYSETFFSAQGEGQYIGVPSLWIRFFLCNLQCNGFGQIDPTDKDSWDLPYEKIDLTNITRVEDLPVFDKGCDSSYTWAKKFRHLMKDKETPEIIDELQSLLPHGAFKHPQTGQYNHMVFTGGEPMMNQEAINSILHEFYARNNPAPYVTVETNGTKPLKESGLAAIAHTNDVLNGEWFWSVSPKLWNTAGERPERAIKPEVVGAYAEASPYGQLKFVVNGSEAAWKEVEDNVKAFRDAGCNFPVWIMGVGGTLEGLKVTEADIADETIQRGYNYTSRVHVHIYGNAIGK